MKNFDKEQVSNEFFMAFTGAGSYVSETCGFCGRVHFVNRDSEGGNYEEGHYEDLLARMEREPEKYVMHTDAISYGYLAGVLFIPECPCNGGTRYEKFIINHASQIADFMQAMAERKQKEADEAKENAGKTQMLGSS